MNSIRPRQDHCMLCCVSFLVQGTTGNIFSAHTYFGRAMRDEDLCAAARYGGGGEYCI